MRNKSLHLSVDGALPCCSTNGRGFLVTYNVQEVTCSRCHFLLDHDLPTITANAILTHTVAGNEDAGRLAVALIRMHGAEARAAQKVAFARAALEQALADADVIKGYMGYIDDTLDPSTEAQCS